MSALFPFEMNMPTRVVFGEGCVQKLPELASGFGRRLLIVAGHDLEEYALTVQRVFAAPEWTVRTLSLESAEPPCAAIDEAARALREDGFEFLIGLGGGSAIDTAKALSISLTHVEPIWMYANLSNRPPLPLTKPLLPVIAVPTTAGTGAEVTPYAVLTNRETEQKGTIQQPEIFPRVALVDPRFAVSMPDRLTAATGVDAFAHALEASLNVSKPSPVAEWAGREAMRLIFTALPRLLLEPGNIDLRATMAWASLLAGVAIAHRGTTVAHAIAEPLGALAHVPHGEAVALCTLPVLRRTMASSEGARALTDLAQRVTPQAPDAACFLKKMELLLDATHVPSFRVDLAKTPHATGLADTLLDNVLTYKFRPLKQHPVQFGREDIAAIIREVIHG